MGVVISSTYTSFYFILYIYYLNVTKGIMLESLQDFMDTFFSGSSATDKGTLFHLENVFGHRSVQKDIGERFNHTAEFIMFVTYGYTILAAMNVLFMKQIDDKPVSLSTVPDKTKYIQTVSNKVVDLVWANCSYQSILQTQSIEQRFHY